MSVTDNELRSWILEMFSGTKFIQGIRYSAVILDVYSVMCGFIDKGNRRELVNRIVGTVVNHLSGTATSIYVVMPHRLPRSCYYHQVRESYLYNGKYNDARVYSKTYDELFRNLSNRFGDDPRVIIIDGDVIAQPNEIVMTIAMDLITQQESVLIHSDNVDLFVFGCLEKKLKGLQVLRTTGMIYSLSNIFTQMIEELGETPDYELLDFTIAIVFAMFGNSFTPININCYAMYHMIKSDQPAFAVLFKSLVDKVYAEKLVYGDGFAEISTLILSLFGALCQGDVCDMVETDIIAGGAKVYDKLMIPTTKPTPVEIQDLVLENNLTGYSPDIGYSEIVWMNTQYYAMNFQKMNGNVFCDMFVINSEISWNADLVMIPSSNDPTIYSLEEYILRTNSRATLPKYDIRSIQTIHTAFISNVTNTLYLLTIPLDYSPAILGPSTAEFTKICPELALYNILVPRRRTILGIINTFK